MAPRLRNLPARLVTQSTAIAALPRKEADPHYLTPEHRAWRLAVLKQAGFRCQAVGCAATGRLYADHVRELRDGGAPLDLANGQALCATHHALKTADTRAQRMATTPAPRAAPEG